jgi:hypothetical protein
MTNLRTFTDSNHDPSANPLARAAVMGQATRLFPATGPDAALELVDSRATPREITLLVYRPTGRPQYVTATPD